MAVNWPYELPLNPSSYNEQQMGGALRTATDSGPGKSRRRFTKYKTKAQVTYLMTNAQAVLFKNYWIVYMQSGAIKLNYKHPWDGIVREVTIPEAPQLSSADPLNVNVSFSMEFM